MKYAVEVAKTGSINKAAETLLIAQPNLSRSIKELEAELKITIFKRTSKGMSLTSEGEDFIESASRILNQVDYMEKKYHDGLPNKQRFSISVPRSSYISDAFISFSNHMNNGPAEFVYKESGLLKGFNPNIKMPLLRKRHFLYHKVLTKLTNIYKLFIHIYMLIV